MSREAKLNLFGKLVYETIQRCRKKAKIRKKKVDSLVIVHILEVAAYSNPQQLQG